MSIAMPPREFMYRAEKWGFKRVRTSSNSHVIMQREGDDKQITIRSVGAVNDDTLRQAANIVGATPEKFLEGPPQVQKVVKRRKKGSAKTDIVNYLIDHGPVVNEGGGALSDLAQALPDHMPATVSIAVIGMVNAGEAVIERRGYQRKAFRIALKAKNAPAEEVIGPALKPPEPHPVAPTLEADPLSGVDARKVADEIFARVTEILVKGGSPEIKRLEQSLADQVAYSQKQRDQLRVLEEEKVTLTHEVDRLKREIVKLQSRQPDPAPRNGQIIQLTPEVKDELHELNRRKGH